MRKLSMLLMALLVVTVLTGCGGGSEETKVRTGEVLVNMQNLQYRPSKFTVKAGTKVTFFNKDAMEHDVIQIELKQLGKGQPGFDSGLIKPQEKWSMTFDKPGVYPILCTQYNHYTAGMVGTITVVD